VEEAKMEELKPNYSIEEKRSPAGADRQKKRKKKTDGD
jgi:hypothetical protein